MVEIKHRTHLSLPHSCIVELFNVIYTASVLVSQFRLLLMLHPATCTSPLHQHPVLGYTWAM